MRATGEYFTPQGTGAYFTPQGTGAYFPYQAPLGQNQNGQTTGVRELATASALVWLAARAGGGYVVGRAMAPSRGDRGTWGWVGMLVGAFTGPIGLGLMGFVSMEARD